MDARSGILAAMSRRLLAAGRPDHVVRRIGPATDVILPPANGEPVGLMDPLGENAETLERGGTARAGGAARGRGPSRAGANAAHGAAQLRRRDRGRPEGAWVPAEPRDGSAGAGQARRQRVPAGDGIRLGLLFPRADGKPWRSHDWKNWTRRVWHVAREGAGIEPLPPYDLRHACASLQVRAGLSIPALAEQMGG